VIFNESHLEGAYVIEQDRVRDERGFFARTYCRHEFEVHGLNPTFVQCNTSFNARKGTLRGMHYQAAPYQETKLVRCTMGAIYDVIIDLRAGSQTFGQWLSAELTSENGRMLYIPESFAHGFLTLQDNTEVFYQMSEFYVPDCSRGVRWNDRAFNIQWPFDVVVISERDSQYADFVPAITS
jgi:dTDP-4-dehydrorhamnose 3,5-epimerase